MVILFVYGCKNNTDTSVSSNKISNDTTHFFPVKQFIQQQVDEVNRTPYYIYKISEESGVKDSVSLNNATFNKLAEEFLKDDISDPAVKKYYNENLFFDETTKSFTFSYTATNDNLPLQSVTVLVMEDGKTVKRILLRKYINRGDSSTLLQMGWKPDESFQVIELINKDGDDSEKTRTNTVVWNEGGKDQL